MIEVFEGETAPVELTVGADLTGATVKVVAADQASSIVTPLDYDPVDLADGRINVRVAALRPSEYVLQVGMVKETEKRTSEPVGLLVRSSYVDDLI